MGEARATAIPEPQLRGQEASIQSLLVSLRSAGAQRLDPARFHYMEVLSQRMQSGPGDLRCILEGKLNAALAEYGERFRQTLMTASDEAASLSGRRPELARELRRLLADGDTGGVRRLGAQAAVLPACVPLVQLNQYLRRVSQDGADSGLEGDAGVGSEMKSVRRFRGVWRRIAAEQQVEQAVGRGPENAGPLNSHRLVLRSLESMRRLSPDYLRQFMSHMDALLWLEQAGDKHRPVAGKPRAARQGRQKKRSDASGRAKRQDSAL